MLRTSTRKVGIAGAFVLMLLQANAGLAQSPNSAPSQSSPNTFNPNSTSSLPSTSVSVSSYLPSIDVSPPRFLRIEPDGARDTTDYFEQVMQSTSNRIFRFVAVPIPVYVKPTASNYLAACTKALDTWQSRTNGMIRFSRVNSPDGARISIVWSHLGLPKDQSSTEFGAHTITQWDIKKIDLPFGVTQGRGSVKPQIIEVNLDVIDVREPDRRVPLLQNLITHELGHALGIIGHSPQRGDMMFSNTDEYSRISQRDLNTLQKIYSRNCDFPL